jgi:DNA-binding MarR family transcriptional regulator
MSTLPADQSLSYLVLDVARLMTTAFEARAKSIGVTRAQWSLIAALVRVEGCNQAQLAELMQISPISLGRLVDRMQKAGWVERRAVRGDRRTYRLFLTSKAHAIRPALRQLSDELQEQALAELSTDQRTQLLAALGTVRSGLAGRQVESREAQRVGK